MDLLLQVTELYGKTTTYFLIFPRGEFTCCELCIIPRMCFFFCEKIPRMCYNAFFGDIGL
jgi:hypothetical protein